MKRYLGVFVSVFIIFGCCDDPIDMDTDNPIDMDTDMDDPIDMETDISSICLEDFELEVRQENCQNSFDMDCELNHLGSLALSVEAKRSFINFCPGVNSTLNFVNADNESLVGEITEKEYWTGAYSIVRFTADCVDNCLDNEIAEIRFKSDMFTLRIKLLISLTWAKNDMDEWAFLTGTTYQIWATYNNLETGGTSSQRLFDLPIQDNGNEVVNPDTTYIRFHETVSLNNTIHSNVYSNENKVNVNGYTRKEIVYFNVDEGLIAVRDSLGVLWTMVK